MICVTIARNRHALAEKGAALVEFRLDWLSKAPSLRRLLTGRPTPVIITCRREKDGGKFQGSEEQRLAILRQAVVDGADFVDLEEDAAGSIPRYGKTRRIVSYHNFDETPHDLEAIRARLAARDADIVKLATHANAPADNVRMLKVVAGSKLPTVGFCMGDVGQPSRMLACRYGAPFTFASVQRGGAVAPGMLSFDELREVYRLDELNRETQVYGVIGDPVAHSQGARLQRDDSAQRGSGSMGRPAGRRGASDRRGQHAGARRKRLAGIQYRLPSGGREP
jgi:3-dehydroquinate dehydratase/shikimate dehydrogenase